MAKTKKPTQQPSLPFPPAADTLHQEGNWLWIPLRKEWRDVTTKPEEIVRQKFIRTLVEHYGYALEQMDQERRTQHGHKSPRADIVIWQTATEEAMKLHSVREQIESRLTGTSPTMKNISKPSLLDIEFPLPDIEVQEQLVESVASARAIAVAKRTEAATLRQSAWAAFESALFTPAEPSTA